MSYLGRSAKLSLKAQEKVSFLATAGQTVKTGLSYTPSFVEVYVNGVLLTDTTDFTATNGNSVTFTVALLVNDEVTVISLKTFTVADHYNKTEADTLLAAKLPLAGGTMTGDTAHGDNVKAKFGAGDDLKIWSDGAASHIVESGTGNLNIRGDDLAFTNTAANKTYLNVDAASGTVYVRHGGSTKLNTTSTGVAVTGGIALGGTAAANTLDDYEEGVFSPVVRGSTSAGSFSTSGGHGGRYTKIGDVCTLNFVIQGTLSGATGSYSQFNLPFVAKAGTSVTVKFSYVDTPNLNHVDFSCYVGHGVTLGYFIIKTANTSTPVYPAPSSFMPAAVQMYGTATYTVA